MENGYLELLQWLIYSHGCPRDEWICDDAARYGHLEVILQYLISQGCLYGMRGDMRLQQIHDSGNVDSR